MDRITGRRDLRAAAIIVAAVTVLGGCGGTGSSAPSTAAATPTAGPTATPEPTQAPTPTPAPTIDLGALGDAYLAIAKTLVDTVTPLYDIVETDGHTIDEAAAAYAGLVDGYRATARAIEKLEFPAEAQADVDALVGVLDQIADQFELSADDPNLDNFDAVDALLVQVPEIGGRIRAAIGLPPPPTAAPG